MHMYVYIHIYSIDTHSSSLLPYTPLLLYFIVILLPLYLILHLFTAPQRKFFSKGEGTQCYSLFYPKNLDQSFINSLQKMLENQLRILRFTLRYFFLSLFSSCLLTLISILTGMSFCFFLQMSL